MNVLAALHTPKSPFSSVFHGYVQLGRTLRAAGGALQIVAPSDFPSLGRVHARWYPLLYPPTLAHWLRRRAHAFDVVVFHSYAGWVANLTRAGGLARITAFHGMEPLFYRQLQIEAEESDRPLSWRFRAVHGWLVPRLLRLSCRRSDRVFCLNESERAYLRRHGWASAIDVNSLGIEPDFYATIQYAPTASVLLFVGQWLATKGTAALVGAFERLARVRPELRLRCVGTLQDEETVRSSFAPDVRLRVHVVPRTSHDALPALFRAADLFVFPSLYEAFGRALGEAMATGLPIVTTPVGVAADRLTDGESCLMVPPRRPDRLADAIEGLLDDAVRRERFGTSARRQAEAITQARVQTDLLDKLRRAADGRTRTS